MFVIIYKKLTSFKFPSFIGVPLFFSLSVTQPIMCVSASERLQDNVRSEESLKNIFRACNDVIQRRYDKGSLEFQFWGCQTRPRQLERGESSKKF